MDSSTKYECLRLNNETGGPLRVHLEPWGEVYTIAANLDFEIVAKGPEGGLLEFALSSGSITIYGWPGSTVKVISGGKDLDTGSWEKTPAPGVPDVNSLREFVDRFFQQ